MVKDIRKKSSEYLVNIMIPGIQKDFTGMIQEPFELNLGDDRETIFFKYPRSFENKGLVDMIRLEIGALAACSPKQTAFVQSYASQQFTPIIGDDRFNVQVISPLRTFWEKITILHKAAFFPENEFPSRYSRHYYDVFELCQTNIKDRALHDLEMMKEVIDFNRRFYPKSSYHFELAKPGSFRLIPDESNRIKLESDYKAMELMFFSEHPSFDEMMEQIRNLEIEINHI